MKRISIWSATKPFSSFSHRASTFPCNIDACPYKWMCVRTLRCKPTNVSTRDKEWNTKMHKNKAKMYFALLLHTIFVSFCAFWSASPPKRRDETRIKTAYNLHQTSSPSIPFTMRPIECIFFNKKRKII